MTVQELMDRLAGLDPQADVQIIDTNSGYVYVIQEEADISEEDIKFTDEKIAWLTVEEI